MQLRIIAGNWDETRLAMIGVGRSRGRGAAAVGAAASVLAVALNAAAALAASPNPCPALPGAKLVYIDIFDGPPENHADLVPDQHREPYRQHAWNVWQLEAGPQGVYVKCGYGKAMFGPYNQMETVRLPDTVKSCQADFRMGRTAAELTLLRFSCR